MVFYSIYCTEKYAKEAKLAETFHLYTVYGIVSHHCFFIRIASTEGKHRQHLCMERIDDQGQ